MSIFGRPSFTPWATARLRPALICASVSGLLGEEPYLLYLDVCQSVCAAMITHRECRERAAECRETAKRAPSASVQAILIDMARTWERLALQILQSSPHDKRFSQSDQMAFPFTADFGGEERILG